LADFELNEEQLASSRVLLVDDEPIVTQTLAAFFEIELGIDAIVHNKPTDALLDAQDNDLDLVVSDFIMPEMNGIDLLSKLRQTKPEVPRILLTGYADKQSAIEAINRARLFQYIEKPWENVNLKHVVVSALTQRFLMRMVAEKIAALEDAEQEMQEMYGALARAFC